MKAYLSRRRSTEIKEVTIHCFKGSVVKIVMGHTTHWYENVKRETNHHRYCKTRQEAVEWIVEKAEQDISVALGVINRAEKVIDHFAEEIQYVRS